MSRRGFINPTEVIQKRTYLIHIRSPIIKAAFGRLHKDGLAAFGGQPTFVEIIMGDQVYNMGAYSHILRGVSTPPLLLGGFINPGKGGLSIQSWS